MERQALDKETLTLFLKTKGRKAGAEVKEQVLTASFKSLDSTRASHLCSLQPLPGWPARECVWENEREIEKEGCFLNRGRGNCLCPQTEWKIEEMLCLHISAFLSEFSINTSLGNRCLQAEHSGTTMLRGEKNTNGALNYLQEVPW